MFLSSQRVPGVNHRHTHMTVQCSRIEILNDGGFRSDGRLPSELRSLAFDLSPQAGADGSATVSHGLTQVLVSVFGPREAKSRAQTMHDRAAINVEVSVAPFSTGDRRRRGRGDKRVQEIVAMIKSTFEPVVQTTLYPHSQIDIFVHVLQQDGGVLQACINATTLALTAAGVPLLDLVCAITAGVHSTSPDSPLLDLTTLEENDCPSVTVAVMPRSGKLTLVSLETRVHVDVFERILEVVGEAGKVLSLEMKRAVLARTKMLKDAMGAGLRTSDFAEDAGDER